MTRQQQWDNLFLSFAQEVSQMSYANKLKVGAVAVRDNRVICIGYNGTPPGEDNQCEVVDDYGNLVTKPNVIHAERNLILFAERNNISLTECTLYLTHSPCPDCCILLEKAKFVRVFYKENYRDLSGIPYLRAHNIIVRSNNEY